MGRCCGVAWNSLHHSSTRRRSRLKSSLPGESVALKVMTTKPRKSFTSLETQASFQEIAHNQVIVAAFSASLLGQILKPFTSALEGKGFNWKLVLRSGGMPSSHSAAVTATCMSLALERGFEDSLFGLSVVFASIVIYDAQGVRRQVGKQAEVMNTLVLSSVPESSAKSKKPTLLNVQYSSVPNVEHVNLPAETELDSPEDSEYSKLRLRVMAPAMSSLKDKKTSMRAVAHKQSGRLSKNSEFESTNDDIIDEENGAYTRSDEFFELAKKLPSVEAGQVNLQELGSLDGLRHVPLKESVGHTKVEVLVGCLWGIFTAIALSQFAKAGMW